MFFLLFLAIFLCGAAVLTGFILGIIGLSTSKKKMRNAGFITGGVGLILLLVSIFYTVNRAVTKVKEAFEPMVQAMDSLNNVDYTQDATEDVRAYLLDSAGNNELFRMMYETSSKKNPSIKDSYYTYFGTPSLQRYPIVWPFAIHCWDSKNYGTLVDEEKVEDIRYAPGNEVNLFFNVQKFVFDDQYLLMKTSTNQLDSTAVEYLLYDMNKKSAETFRTEKDLLKAAKKAGYKGDQQLISIWEYNDKF